MKLNEWGYMQMLVLSLVILGFLFVVVYNVNVLEKSLNGDLNVNYYRDLEEKFEKKSLVYINDYYEEDLMSDGIVITNDILKKYNLNVVLHDKNNNDCKGYVLASKTHGVISTDAYISCKKYETLGYQDWRV